MKKKLLEFELYIGQLNEYNFFSKKEIISTLNASAIEWSKTDLVYKKALQNADILIPDGVSIKIAARILLNEKINKISGQDLFYFMINKLNINNGSCFFLGSSEFVLNKIKQRLAIEYSNIKSEYYSPPFKNAFSESDKNEMINKVNEFSPDVLFVGLSAPKQEKLIYEIGKELNAKVICNIGAVFEIYAGTFKRPSKFWQFLGLEWLITWIVDPKRLKKKEYKTVLKFFFTLFSEKFKQFKKPKSS